MAVKVRIPTTLRTLTAGETEVFVTGDTVGEVLENLESEHPGFKSRIFDEDGTSLRRFVNVFVADEDVRYQNGLDTAVPVDATVSIIPAVAGG